MIVIQTKDAKWYCASSLKVAKSIAGENMENVLNLWDQPFPMPCDFFWCIKDGELLKSAIPMRDWEQDLPLFQCLKGNVEYVPSREGVKPPKWYREFLAIDWAEVRAKIKERAMKAHEKIQEAKASGDKDAEFNAVADYLLGK